MDYICMAIQKQEMDRKNIKHVGGSLCVILSFVLFLASCGLPPR